MQDNIKGLIFGQAICDALGLATEFMTKEEVIHHYPNGIRGYQDIISDRHHNLWQKGAWTDDTYQMLCILDSILENKEVNLNNIASRFVNWKNTNGIGIGRQTLNILSIRDYAENPFKVSELIWNMSRQTSAPNGGIMRTSIVGCWNYKNWEQVKINTENICKLTHYDPRCIGSCVIVTFIISQFLQEKSYSKSDLINIANQYDSRIEEYLELAYQPDVSLLQLDEEGKIGYTLKTMGSALWAYNYSASFSNELLSIIGQGGDADTNGATAGALLGLKYGFSNIPDNLKEELIGKDILTTKSDQFLGNI
ncbi:ADP-ribosylglycohydrolase family protein [Dysgonomonas sp. OttesenSCG-928-M03]|nr:ADP-ribosylglycohydrolase family protein [Dysgonomonas sp. OttesenSCG-928-M03]